MKRMAITVIASLFFWAGGTAKVQAQEITFTSKARQIYLGANGDPFYNGFVPQSDLSLAWENGFYGDVWFSTALNGRKDFDKEVDITFGKSGKIGQFNYTTNINYFVLVITDVMNVNGETNRNLQINRKVNLAPFLRGEVYFPVHKGGPRQGLMVVSGIRSSSELHPRVILLANYWFKMDSGCFGYDRALLGQGFVGLGFKVNGKVTVTPGVTVSKPLTSVSDGRRFQSNPEIAISYRF
ncbi:MAG: hypothetical protein A2735_00960 [Candidatus Yanofskybacteria bacterium RIFCSPHIGHO2_01_FULL_41_21]|uniref:Outer membrane protein beta-barrel domain-containing protein n=1 Tax=Candidatus Yanofskybacteria bacterium RIFCSPHIGHO2_01_FULL_41_21 TaxID=1802660 RepID=A0A1F8EC86_9BACT|nr:MAG: hypothetical protein A2735_00960 [Candidatus Yanofskybacteria bacterium RIFCSPHIGHO2_01_FULL_41_21]